MTTTDKGSKQGLSEPGTSELEQAAREARPGLVAEFGAFLVENKKWWLLPIIVIVLGLGGLVLLSGSGAAPFIYTLF